MRGAFRFTDSLQANPQPPQVLTITNQGVDAVLNWLPPIGNPGNLQAYHLYREGLFMASVGPNVLTYTDYDLSNGYYHYCIKAAYTNATSPQLCASTSFTVGLTALQNPTIIAVYPNPFHSDVSVTAETLIDELNLFTIEGKLLLRLKPTENTVKISMDHIQKGVYIIVLSTNGKMYRNKLVRW